VIHHQQDETTTTVDRRDMNHHQPSHLSSLSSFDELKIMSNEIDKQMTKKTNEIIILLKELLSGTLPTADFHAKMNGVGEISTSDLHSISRKLIKRHKFEHNPNQKDFMRMKSLQFPTNSKDLGELLIASSHSRQNRLFILVPFCLICSKLFRKFNASTHQRQIS